MGKNFDVGSNINTFQADGALVDEAGNVWTIHSVLSPTRAIYYHTIYGYFGYDINGSTLITLYSKDGADGSWGSPNDVVFTAGTGVLVSTYILVGGK